MPTYSVMLQSANFSSDPTDGSITGTFSWQLLVNNQSQTQIPISVTMVTTSTSAVTAQAKQQLGAALQGWLTSMPSS